MKFICAKSFKAVKKEIDDGYVDEIYDSGIKKISAYFEITLPAFENNLHLQQGLKLKIKSFDLSIEIEEEFTIKTIEN